MRFKYYSLVAGCYKNLSSPLLGVKTALNKFVALTFNLVSASCIMSVDVVLLALVDIRY